jgi:hypothetical protein
MSNDPVDDYEECSICGFDHEYEYEQAHRKHILIGKDKKHPEHKNEQFYRGELNLGY